MNRIVRKWTWMGGGAGTMAMLATALAIGCGAGDPEDAGGIESEVVEIGEAASEVGTTALVNANTAVGHTTIEDVTDSSALASDGHESAMRDSLGTALAPISAASASSNADAALAPVEADARCQEPVYIIAHRCNDAADPADVVQAHGNNAIESDFSWGTRDGLDGIGNDDEWAVDHDGVFEGSTHLSDWIGQVKAELDRPGSPLALVMLDIKDPHGPLLQLYNTVRGGLGPDVNLILSIPDYSQRGRFSEIAAAINDDPRAGVAIDYLVEGNVDETQANVQAFFQSIGITKYWFADGYNVTAATPQSVIDNVNDGIALRDGETDCSAYHGVYSWTYEDDETIRDFFNWGVNGLLMNADECHFIVGNPDWEIVDAVSWVKNNLPNKRFALPADNPFDLNPEITCPDPVVVECTAPGGTYNNDPQLVPFLGGSAATSDWCSLDLTNDAPVFHPVNSTSEVTFTVSAEGYCSPADSCSSTVTVEDTVAPIITCPADIAVDPVSPAGTAVTFAATATDVCDASLVPLCPQSGNTFQIGTTTTVSCSVADQSMNDATCSLTVKVYTPQEVVANLQGAVSTLGVPHGKNVSLLATLAAILKSIDDDKKVPLCAQLNSFIAKVNKLIDDGYLTAAEGQPLIQSANNLKSTFQCWGGFARGA